jgi:hypothetical protein
MKDILIFFGVMLIAMAFAQTTNAQSNKEETEFMQSIFGMEKKAIVAKFMKIESSNPFRALCDVYETKRKELGKDGLNTLTNYVENYDNLADDKYDEVVASMKSLRNGNDKLTDSYYKKIKKASGSKIAVQFFQLENYFRGEIRSTVMEGIPYISEFDK